jgi:hypothetical protein
MAVKESDVMQVLDSALGAFGDAMKAGVRAQEEMVKWWSGSVENVNPLGDWQKRSRQFFDEGVPAAQKQAQEWMKLVEQNYRRSVELLKKAVDTDHNGAVEGMREKLRTLWEESIAVVKENAEAMAQANVRLMESWSDLLRKNLEQAEAKGFSVPPPPPVSKPK